MKKHIHIAWHRHPVDHDYPVAALYLGLIYKPKDVANMVVKLREGAMTNFKAKDIFRASGLSILGVSDSHVKKEKIRIKKGVHLSPLLLVQDSVNGKVVIADGYHRLCAVYSYDEDALIPCKII